jgi:putative SOS response-associated peptidase YedK
MREEGPLELYNNVQFSSGLSMCGRYNLRATPAEIQEFFNVLRMPAEQGRLRYNIAPTQFVPIIRQTDDGRECVMARWGLIPSWAKDRTIGNRLINARVETVAEKPSFRGAMKHRRRCLVPTTGYYEWKMLDTKVKQPYHIRMTGNRPFAFAGLWESWEKGEKPVESFTIITVSANPSLVSLHDRMPVILPPDVYAVWLDSEVPTDGVLSLLKPYALDDVEAYAVNTVVNNVKNDVPECIEPA